MATTEELYPVAAALGRQQERQCQVRPKKLDCIVFHLRDGTDFHYTYRNVSAVAFTSKSELVIYCSCGHIDTITLKGLNLRRIAGAIANASVAELHEADANCAESDVMVTEVRIQPIERPS
jgi:hypothetical protein